MATNQDLPMPSASLAASAAHAMPASAAPAADATDHARDALPLAESPAPVVAPVVVPDPDPDPSPVGRTSLRLVGAATLLLLAWWLRPVLVPTLVALLLALTLAPALRVLVELRLPRLLAAFLVLGATVASLVGLLSMLVAPAQAFIERAPIALRRLELRIREWRQPFDDASDAAQRLIGAGPGAGDAAAPGATGMGDALYDLVAHAPLIAGSAVAIFFLAFMMLVHGDAQLRKLVTLMPHLSAKKDLIAGTREAQRELSRYLLMITLINLGLGIATAAVLTVLGVEDAVLWGGIAALATYAPYVGPALVTLLLVLVGFGQHAEAGAALAVPLSFLVLTTIEGQIVSPLLVGRRLRLDPLLIVLSMLLLGWLWGIAGLLIAVPLLTCLRVVAQRWPGAEPLSMLLTDER